MIKKYIKDLLLLSLPLIAGQMGQMLIGVGDVYVASIYKTEAVAAIGVANGILNPFLLFGIGLMMGISPSLAQMRGANDGDDKAKNNISSIIVYSGVVGLVMTMMSLLVARYIPLFGFDPVLIPSMEKYISIVAWSFPFALIFQGIKEYLQGFENVFFANLISIIAVFINLGVNFFLVFGLSDFEGLGEIGLAIASVIIRVLLCGAIIIYALRRERSAKLSLKVIGEFFRFSLPIAFMFFLEVLAFAGVNILSGKIGVISAAANNLIMNIAGIAFMIPLSISHAVSVKVGYAYGEKNKKDIKGYTIASLIIGAGFIVMTSALFFGIPDLLMLTATKDVDVISLGVKLLFVVALFQASDSVQVILAGVLRGLESTKVSFVVIVIGYWLIGVPIGYYLAFYQDYGAVGLWIGLAISLAFVAFILSIYCYQKMKKIQLS